MKKLILAISILFVGSVVKADSNILFKLGTVNVLLPFADVSATYLFDGVAKQSLVGAETPLVQWHKLQLTGGAVSSVQGEGTPFVGINLIIDNPARNFVPLTGLNLGIFGGRNFNQNEWMAGVKAAVSIFN